MPSKWFKLYPVQWLTGTIRFEYDPAERAVFIDLLSKAAVNDPPGEVKFMNYKQLAANFQVPVEVLESTIEKGIKYEKFKYKKSRKKHEKILKVVNWAKYQSEYLRQKPYRKTQSDRTETAISREKKGVTLLQPKESLSYNERCNKVRIEEKRGEEKRKEERRGEKATLQDDLSTTEKPQKSSKPQKKKLLPIKDFSELIEEEKNKITPTENLPLPKAMKFNHKDEAVELRAEIGQITKNIKYIDECFRDGKNKDNHAAMEIRREKHAKEREKLRQLLSEIYQLYL